MFTSRPGPLLRFSNSKPDGTSAFDVGVLRPGAKVQPARTRFVPPEIVLPGHYRESSIGENAEQGFGFDYAGRPERWQDNPESLLASIRRGTDFLDIFVCSRNQVACVSS